MMLLTLIALQAASGLSNTPPRDERLRFVFVRDGRDNRPKISGALATPTEWSRPAFFNIVQKCGGKGLGIEDGNGRRIVVTGESSRNDLDIARCVQASTSVRFWAGVKEHGLGSVLFDQQPFRALWDDRS